MQPPDIDIEDQELIGGSPSARPSFGNRARTSFRTTSGVWGPRIIVAAAVCFGLVELRAERTNVAFLNDSSLHEQMVRFAMHQLRSGHFPLDSWFPYLGLGSPLFLHYQSVGETLTAIFGLLVGGNTAYDWSVYLLIALWPICIFSAARVFGWDRPTAAMCSVVSPFIVSVPGIGYEQSSYVFYGFGVYDQLVAMWLLPLALAYSWRAVSQGRNVLPAVALVAATAATHFFTGYLAFTGVFIWPFLAPRHFLRRLKRAICVAVAAGFSASWVIVPLIVERRWTPINEFLAGTSSANSYGAPQVLRWLFSGQLFDSDRLPVITLLAGVGAVVCVLRWRALERARVVLVLFATFLLLYFGRPTLGPLVDLLPSSQDLFLRRFEMGVDLSALFLAGIGASAIAGYIARYGRRFSPAAYRKLAPRGQLLVRWALASVLLVVALAPAWSQLANYDNTDAAAIRYQLNADASAGQQLSPILATVRTLGLGRVYAGLPTNWGASFLVGDVPVFKYLESQDIDEVGYTLRTASMMTDPEALFDESNLSDYLIFGVRYLLLPTGQPPRVGATLLITSGPYSLWEIPSSSYFQVAAAAPSISANRTNVGLNSERFLRSNLAARSLYPTVSWAGAPAGPATGEAAPGVTVPGVVSSENVNLLEGTASATVNAYGPAVVVLKVSYDPGWTATVDGNPASTEMIAPALVGVPVPAGTHVVSLRYRAFSGYPELFAVSAITLVAVGYRARLRRLAVRMMKRN